MLEPSEREEIREARDNKRHPLSNSIVNETVIMVGNPDIFLQYRMGDLTLPNCIVMTPMIPSHARDANVPRR